MSIAVDDSKKHALIGAVLDWRLQGVDFERDGSLRDIYIRNASIEDWKAVVAHVVAGSHGARLYRAGKAAPIPTDFEPVFGGDEGQLLSFTIGGVELDCHYFTRAEIELSFSPTEVTEASLRALLDFVIELGELTKKPAVITPENAPDCPIFKYDPEEQRLVWIPPRRGGGTI